MVEGQWPAMQHHHLRRDKEGTREDARCRPDLARRKHRGLPKPITHIGAASRDPNRRSGDPVAHE